MFLMAVDQEFPSAQKACMELLSFVAADGYSVSQFGMFAVASLTIFTRIITSSQLNSTTSMRVITTYIHASICCNKNMTQTRQKSEPADSDHGSQ
ncbi:hypothetical protein D5086_000262 [Populus alba]|uniref:Uncharacterized protein n=1 Tax=Populus alba TaxID=43335 RepID=A0ACC4CVB2_POPAL